MIKNGATFNCIMCGAESYRCLSNIARGRTKLCRKPECRYGPKPYARKGDTFNCVVCGAQFYRNPYHIKRGLTKTCGKSECRQVYMRRPRPGPRPYRKTGAMLKCVACGEDFYRKPSLIERGVNNTCGKSECKSKFFSGANNPAWGRIPTAEDRKAVSENNKRRSGPPKGYKPTLEARAKISQAMKRRWLESRCDDRGLNQTAEATRANALSPGFYAVAAQRMER
jgi:hypothetical protein